TALAHWIAGRGVKADELALIQRLARAIAGDMSLERNFRVIQELTQRLVPYEQMGFARYDESRHEMEIVTDTARPQDSGGPPVRYHADQGLTGEALRRRGAGVTSSRTELPQVPLPDQRRRGARRSTPARRK